MAYAYSSLYSLKTTGLRFFTVYGPWDRPDMALTKFTSRSSQGSQFSFTARANTAEILHILMI